MVSSEAPTAPEEATDSSDGLTIPCGPAGATRGVARAGAPVTWPTVRTTVPSRCRWASHRANASSIVARTARPPHRLPLHTWWNTSGSQPPCRSAAVTVRSRSRSVQVLSTSPAVRSTIGLRGGMLSVRAQPGHPGARSPTTPRALV